MLVAFGSTLGRRAYLLAFLGAFLLYVPAVPVHVFGTVDPDPMWLMLPTVCIATCFGASSKPVFPR